MINILFVCTSNTCRSPMAEYLFKKKTEQYSKYISVSSAGISAFSGDVPSDGAVKAMKKFGIDISNHRSRKLTSYELDSADYCFCMSKTQFDLIRPLTSGKLYTLGKEIGDPFCLDEDSYLQTAFDIDSALDEILRGDIFYSFEDVTDDDIDDLLEIEGKCFAKGWTRQNFVDELSSDCFIGFSSKYLGKTVGFILAQSISGEIFISDVAVMTEFRHRHLASRLMEKLFDYAEKTNPSMITLEVRQSNNNAIRLYENFGFKNVGIRKKYYSEPLEDAIIMTFYF